MFLIWRCGQAPPAWRPRPLKILNSHEGMKSAQNSQQFRLCTIQTNTRLKIVIYCHPTKFLIAKKGLFLFKLCTFSMIFKNTPFRNIDLLGLSLSRTGSSFLAQPKNEAKNPRKFNASPRMAFTHPAKFSSLPSKTYKSASVWLLFPRMSIIRNLLRLQIDSHSVTQNPRYKV